MKNQSERMTSIEEMNERELKEGTAEGMKRKDGLNE
jgi:hypothetical protein